MKDEGIEQEFQYGSFKNPPDSKASVNSSHEYLEMGSNNLEEDLMTSAMNAATD